MKLRFKGAPVSRDRPVQKQNLPIACQELLKALHEKVMVPAPFALEAQSFAKEKVQRFPPEATDGNPYEDDDDPWAAVDVNEFEGPSVGKAKASHPAPKPAAKAAAKAPSSSTSPRQATLTGEPGPENVEDGTIMDDQVGPQPWPHREVALQGRREHQRPGGGTCRRGGTPIRAHHSHLLGDGRCCSAEIPIQAMGAPDKGERCHTGPSGKERGGF